MKKQIHLLLFIAGISTSLAQPTITATGINPVIGETITSNATNYVNPGSSGANQTWDLSSMVVTSTNTSTAMAPSATPNGASFPNANLSFSGGGVYAYYNISNAAWQNYGSQSTVTMSYSDPEDFLHFPFTYNNTYTDTWATSFVNGGYTFFRSGTTTVTADGYGTLITPGGTVTDILRVRFHQVYKDSADVGGFPYIINYENDQYMWYKDGTHSAIATVYNLTNDMGSPATTGGSYMDVVSGINETKFVNSYTVSPNPASDKLVFFLNITQEQKIKIKLYNAIGQEVKASEERDGVIGDNFYEVNIQDLPEGIYFAAISYDNAVITMRKIMISK